MLWQEDVLGVAKRHSALHKHQALAAQGPHGGGCEHGVWPWGGPSSDCGRPPLLLTLACLPGSPTGGFAPPFLCTGDVLGLGRTATFSDRPQHLLCGQRVCCRSRWAFCLSSWHAETSLCLLFLFLGQRQAVVHTGRVCSGWWAQQARVMLTEPHGSGPWQLCQGGSAEMTPHTPAAHTEGPRRQMSEGTGCV